MSRVACCGLILLCGLVGAKQASAEEKQCIVLNNSAVVLQEGHHLLAARDAYQACLADPACPAPVRSECEQEIAQLNAIIPTVLVTVVDEQKRDLTTHASLQVDGEAIQNDGLPLRLDPGAHELTVAHPGMVNSITKLVAVEGEVDRTLEIALQASPPVAGAPPTLTLATPVQSRKAAAVAERRTPPSAPSERRTKVPMYLLGGVSALGAASFAFFGLSGDVQRNQLYQCKPNCDPSEVRRVSSHYLAADLSLGASVLALAGAYWLYRARPKPTSATLSATSFSLALTAVPGEGGLSVRWDN
jgi:hypothetical protein